MVADHYSGHHPEYSLSVTTSEMARQFLGRPASSAGVERMFSKAGKLYDDEKKGQEDESLEHTLFASANTE